MHLDEYLARLWERSREPRLLAVVSPHGAEPPHGWREAWRVLRLRPAVKGYFDRGPNGVLLLLGEGIRAGAMVRPAELVDLVPTLLYGLGFPIARDFDGAVLTAAFDTSFLARRPLTFMPSYETFAAP
jgi:arylsulfatase A-like enzyme